MALPIKETPVLEGEDAKKFIERMENASTRTVSKEEYKRAEDIYKRIKENAEDGISL